MSRHPRTLAMLLLGLAPLVAAAQPATHGPPQHAAHEGHSDRSDHSGHADHSKHSDHSNRSDRSGHAGHPEHDGHLDHGARQARAGHAGHAAHAQPSPQDAHAGHAPAAQGDASPACTPAPAAMGHCTPAAQTPTDAACTPEHAAMGHCTPGLQLPREPVPAVTPADRAAAFPVLAHGDHAHGPAHYALVKFDRFEAWDDEGARGQAWEGSASVGGDLHRLWLRSSGERSGGRTTRTSAELRVSRALAPWWDVVAGLRQDVRPAPSRTRALVGVQGIAPYLFEVSALAYLGEGGHLSARIEAEYDLRFSNRLVLQPQLELQLQARDDRVRDTGSGLTTVEAGLRLRYEFTRRFAPYVGLVHERSFGATARQHQASGEASRDTRVVAGVRFWF